MDYIYVLDAVAYFVDSDDVDVGLYVSFVLCVNNVVIIMLGLSVKPSHPITLKKRRLLS